MKQKSTFQKLSLLPKENVLNLNEAKEITGGVGPVVVAVAVAVTVGLYFAAGYWYSRNAASNKPPMRKYM